MGGGNWREEWALQETLWDPYVGWMVNFCSRPKTSKSALCRRWVPQILSCPWFIKDQEKNC